MPLDRKTEAKVKALLRGQSCCKCSAPATRLARGRFYCDRHFPYGKGGDGTRSYPHPKL
jgi:hypothetical protein